MTIAKADTGGPRRRSRTHNLYVNPVTNERATLLVSAEDSGGEFIKAEMWAPPGSRVSAPHIHPGQTETFEVRAGRLGLRYGADTRTADTGERIEVPAGTVHDWWTVGDEPARVLIEVRPAGRFEDMIITASGLAAAGRTYPKGVPGLLQIALVSDEFDEEMRFAFPPRPVQRRSPRLWAARPTSRTQGALSRAGAKDPGRAGR